MNQVQFLPNTQRRAAILIVAMLVLLVLTLLGGELVRTMVFVQRQSLQQNRETQALWLAESGISRALVSLTADAEYDGETWQPRVQESSAESEDEGRAAKVIITIESVDGGRQVRVEALYPDHPTDRVLVERVHPLPPAQEESP